MSDTVVLGAVRSILTGALVADRSLPARSLTEELAVRLAPWPWMTLSAGAAPSMPERLSSDVQWIATLSLYQPAAFGPVVGAPLRVGAVVSMLMPLTVASAVLPAASVAVPLTDCALPSPRVDGAGQLAMP